jgi:hypothetical protein
MDRLNTQNTHIVHLKHAQKLHQLLIDLVGGIIQVLIIT